MALVITAASNAVNLTDGLDGLAIGLVGIAASAFALICYVTGRSTSSEYLRIVYLPGSGELAVFCMVLLGASLGFLWFNARPAQVMMGDTGALALGGAIGTLAVLSKMELLLVIIGGVFVIEVLSVIAQVLSFRYRGKRIFRMTPLHHHFELCGWPESKVRHPVLDSGGALCAPGAIHFQDSMNVTGDDPADSAARMGRVDRPLLAIALALVALGIVMVYSASAIMAAERFGRGTFFIERHLVRVGIGLALMLALARLPATSSSVRPASDASGIGPSAPGAPGRVGGLASGCQPRAPLDHAGTAHRSAVGVGRRWRWCFTWLRS